MIPPTMTARKTRYYGWRGPGRPDQNDCQYSAPHEILKALPSSVDLRPLCSPVLDQGNLGSCVSNAVAGAVQFLMMKENIPTFAPSRLFIYYNGRLAEGTVKSDSGESVKDGVRSVALKGVCAESEWPYTIEAFTAQPTQQCYTDAKLTLALQYQRVQQNSMQMLGCLASGYPFLIGFTVYESFESQAVDETGVVPMPRFGEHVLGGHCVEIVGYNTNTRLFLFKNSWGTSWGDQGYGYMPFAYLQDSQLSSDFWTIRQVS